MDSAQKISERNKNFLKTEESIQKHLDKKEISESLVNISKIILHNMKELGFDDGTFFLRKNDEIEVIGFIDCDIVLEISCNSDGIISLERNPDSCSPVLQKIFTELLNCNHLLKQGE